MKKINKNSKKVLFYIALLINITDNLFASLSNNTELVKKSLNIADESPKSSLKGLKGEALLNNVRAGDWKCAVESNVKKLCENKDALTDVKEHTRKDIDAIYQQYKVVDGYYSDVFEKVRENKKLTAVQKRDFYRLAQLYYQYERNRIESEYDSEIWKLKDAQYAIEQNLLWIRKKLFGVAGVRKIQELQEQKEKLIDERDYLAKEAALFSKIALNKFCNAERRLDRSKVNKYTARLIGLVGLFYFIITAEVWQTAILNDILLKIEKQLAKLGLEVSQMDKNHINKARVAQYYQELVKVFTSMKNDFDDFNHKGTWTPSWIRVWGLRHRMYKKVEQFERIAKDLDFALMRKENGTEKKVS